MAIIYTSPMYHHQAKRALQADNSAQVAGIAGMALQRLLGLASNLGQQSNQEEYQKRLLGPLTLATMPGAKPYQQMAALSSIHQMSQQHDPSILQRLGFGSTPAGIPAGMGAAGIQAVSKFMPGAGKYKDPLERQQAQADVAYKRALTSEAQMRTTKDMRTLQDKVARSEMLGKAVEQLNLGLDDPKFQGAFLNKAPAQVAMGLGITDVDSDEFKTFREIITHQQKSTKDELMSRAQAMAMDTLQSIDDPDQALDALEYQRHQLLQSGQGFLADDVEDRMLKMIDLRFKGDTNRATRETAYQTRLQQARSNLRMADNQIASLTGKVAAAGDITPELEEYRSMMRPEDMQSDRGKQAYAEEEQRLRSERAPVQQQFASLLDAAKRQQAKYHEIEWKAARAAAKGSATLTPSEEAMAKEYALVHRMMDAGSPEAVNQMWAEANPGKPMPVNLRFTDADTYQEALQEWLSRLDPESVTAR